MWGDCHVDRYLEASVLGSGTTEICLGDLTDHSVAPTRWGTCAQGLAQFGLWCRIGSLSFTQRIPSGGTWNGLLLRRPVSHLSWHSCQLSWDVYLLSPIYLEEFLWCRQGTWCPSLLNNLWTLDKRTKGTVHEFLLSQRAESVCQGIFSYIQHSASRSLP